MPEEVTSHSYSRRAIQDALSVLRDSGSTPTDRRDAAFALFHITRVEAPLDERLVTDIMNVLSLRIAESAVVHHLTHLVSRRVRPPQALTVAILRLCEIAHRDHPGSLPALVSHALNVASWRAGLRAEWIANVVTTRIARGDGMAAVGILAGPFLSTDCIRLILTEHPSLVAEPSLSVAKRWRLHAAYPTVDSWRLLASCEPEREHRLARLECGPATPESVAALERALEREVEGPARLLLARWRVELAEFATRGMHPSVNAGRQEES